MALNLLFNFKRTIMENFGNILLFGGLIGLAVVFPPMILIYIIVIGITFTA